MLCPGVLWPCPASRLVLQVELLLTMEEFCAEEGVFEPQEQQQQQQQGAAPGEQQDASSGGGAAFAPLFANLLQLLYDVDVLEEGAITAWAAEKEHADEEDKVFLRTALSGPIAGLEGAEPETHELLPVGPALFALQPEEGVENYYPVRFYTLPTGESYLHYGARATPKKNS